MKGLGLMTIKTVKRLPNWEKWSKEKVLNILNTGAKVEYEEYPGGLTISGDLPLEKGANKVKGIEAKLAIAIHEAIAPVRSEAPAIVKDNGFWMWFGLDLCREQMIDRWCDGRGLDGKVVKEDRAAYFLSGDSLQAQQRCGVRRLWIAADISKRCSGTYEHVEGLLLNTDTFTGIAERMIGLDAEMAVAVMLELNEIASEDLRRLVAKKVSVVLSTVALEVLDMKQKQKIVQLVVEEVLASAAP